MRGALGEVERADLAYCKGLAVNKPSPHFDAFLDYNYGLNQRAREDAERAANIRDSLGIIIDLQLYVLLEQIYTRLGDTELAEKYAKLSQRTPVPPRKE